MNKFVFNFGLELGFVFLGESLTKQMGEFFSYKDGGEILRHARDMLLRCSRWEK